VQLAIIAFEDGRYSETADQLNDVVPSMANLFSHSTIFKFEPRLKIFTVVSHYKPQSILSLILSGQLFGWDMDSLWQTGNQRRCDALLCTDQVIDAVESYQYMMLMVDDDARDSDPEWTLGECSEVLGNSNIDIYAGVI
jgi:hypothetical protein